MRVAIPCGCAPTAIVQVRANSPRELPDEVSCRRCARRIELHKERIEASGGLAGCLACGHPELYRAKAFPRAVGIAIVVVAAILAPFTFYLSLLLAAVIDLVLYLLVPDVVACYVCQSGHHGFATDPLHPHFDREIEERLKFGERAVMGKPMRAGGTAGAPEPEH